LWFLEHNYTSILTCVLSQLYYCDLICLYIPIEFEFIMCLTLVLCLYNISLHLYRVRVYYVSDTCVVSIQYLYSYLYIFIEFEFNTDIEYRMFVCLYNTSLYQCVCRLLVFVCIRLLAATSPGLGFMFIPGSFHSTLFSTSYV
jgi:hypothetical protein